MDLEKHNQKANTLKKENRIFFDKLKRSKPKNLDAIVHRLHDEIFEKTDCLACANCCKTTSPIFYNKDIERLAKHLRLKPGDFMDKYLRVDEDKDYVLKQAPCPFLSSDNYCSVYEFRPIACREYPHNSFSVLKDLLQTFAGNFQQLSLLKEVPSGSQHRQVLP